MNFDEENKEESLFLKKKKQKDFINAARLRT